jgi:hypothetical protein
MSVQAGFLTCSALSNPSHHEARQWLHFDKQCIPNASFTAAGLFGSFTRFPLFSLYKNSAEHLNALAKLEKLLILNKIK